DCPIDRAQHHASGFQGAAGDVRPIGAEQNDPDHPEALWHDDGGAARAPWPPILLQDRPATTHEPGKLYIRADRGAPAAGPVELVSLAPQGRRDAVGMEGVYDLFDLVARRVGVPRALGAGGEALRVALHSDGRLARPRGGGSHVDAPAA